MKFLIVFVILVLFELLYFKIADMYNIIDKPNERSSHTSVTLRGGGIIFYIGALLFFVWSGFQYPWFFLGLTLMTFISFLDDIYTLSNKLRLIVHFCSVLLMAYELSLFSLPWYILGFSFIFIVGVINAYNFMDGINGITASYSLAVVSLLMIVNQDVGFINNDLLVFSTLGLIVFAFFNFRTKARAFAGDVGSVAIAFILLFGLGALIVKTGNIIYILFLVIYGIDAVWTIIRRMIRKQNIFEAHRSHLYQYLGNEAQLNKLGISFFYGLLQFVIGIIVIFVAKYSFNLQLYFSIGLLLVLSIIYIIVKSYIIKKYRIN